jgi:hypothetical protein
MMMTPYWKNMQHTEQSSELMLARLTETITTTMTTTTMTTNMRTTMVMITTIVLLG